MSNQLITRAVADRRLKGSVKVVLLILADMANAKGECWPGYTTISQRAGVSRMSAIRAVAWLEANSYLSVTRRPVKGNRHKPNHYRVCIPGEQVSSEQPRAGAPGQKGSASLAPEIVPACDPDSNKMIPRVVTTCDPGSNKVIPEPLINQYINPHINPPPPPPQDEEAEAGVRVGKIFRLYQQNFGNVTPLIAQILGEAACKWPTEWIKAAMQESISYNRPSWKYCEGILKRWQREGFRVDSRPKSPPGGRMSGDEFNNMLHHWVDKGGSEPAGLLLGTGDVWQPE